MTATRQTPPTPSRLRLTGPDSAPYELGQPLYVYDGNAHLGTLDPVQVNRDGTEVLISRFVSSPLGRAEKRAFAPLVLLEVTAFLVERFHGVQMVSYSLSRQIQIYGDGTTVAAARSQLLQDIGADGVTISPQPDSQTPGNFVVQGVWTYNERNLEALQRCLRRQRELYAEKEQDAGQAPSAPGLMGLLGLPARLRRWLKD